jgi:FlaA1/EpsC-like NDP-sugar epimerase
MRIWLIGADQAGSEVLRQLKKNPAITVVVSDALERPRAVSDRVIDKVDMVENVTALNINQLARRIRPDLILIDAGAAKRAMGRVSGGLVFTEAMQTEMAAMSETPCLIL